MGVVRESVPKDDADVADVAGVICDASELVPSLLSDFGAGGAR